MTTVERRIKELDKKISSEVEDKWYPTFCRQSSYVGNNIYKIGRLYSSDIRELFLMFVADMEEIDYLGKVEEVENEVE